MTPTAIRSIPRHSGEFDHRTLDGSKAHIHSVQTPPIYSWDADTPRLHQHGPVR